MAFSDNLKTIREFRGKKPMDVVRETGIAKAKYYAYEAGRYEPGPEIVDDLAKYFSVKRTLFYEKSLTPDYIKDTLAVSRVNLSAQDRQEEKKIEYVPAHVLDHYRNTAEHIMQENRNLWELVRELRLECSAPKKA